MPYTSSPFFLAQAKVVEGNDVGDVLNLVSTVAPAVCKKPASKVEWCKLRKEAEEDNAAALLLLPTGRKRQADVSAETERKRVAHSKAMAAKLLGLFVCCCVLLGARGEFLMCKGNCAWGAL